LALPIGADQATPEMLTAYDAVALFVERARQSPPGPSWPPWRRGVPIAVFKRFVT